MTRTGVAATAGACAAWLLKLPIHVYRYSFKAFVGWHCRHLPTCSEYALKAIDRNGAWRGLWLTVSRLSRCRPGGTSGYDPVPDIRAERHILQPWRYGRWTGRHFRMGHSSK
jgi:putative membrane protein insertion efficiency factor